MSEENQKVDKRCIVSKERLLAMERMRQAKAAKALERKNNPEVEKAKPEPVAATQRLNDKVVVIPDSVIATQEVDEVSEDEVQMIPKTKKKTTSPIQPLYGLQDEIQRYVDACLPPEFSKQNRKKQKWEMRKKEIRDEILQSLEPSTTTPQPSKEPQKNEKTATLDISDLFF